MCFAVLLHQTTHVDAQCACPDVYFSPSDYVEMGAVVLRAEYCPGEETRNHVLFVRVSAIAADTDT